MPGSMVASFDYYCASTPRPAARTGMPDTVIDAGILPAATLRSGRWPGLFFAALRAAGDCAASAASCRLLPVRDGAIGSRASLPGSLPIGRGPALARI